MEEKQPTFRRPDEARTDPEMDSAAEQRRYQQYWMERRRIEQEEERNSGLSIYEQSRLP